MNEQSKLRHLAKCIRDDAEKRATELEQIADELDGKNHKPARKTPRNFEEDRMALVRKRFPDFIPSAYQVKHATGWNHDVCKRMVQKLRAERSEIPLTPPPYVPFDERPEVKAAVRRITEMVAGTLGTVAQSLVDDKREQIARVRKHMNI